MINGFNGIPANYDYINVSASMYQPSEIHAQESGLSRYFERYLIQKLISVFKFEGLPDYWSKDYFLYTLFVFGYVTVFNTDKFGIIPQHCSLAGYDVFYRPNKCLVANPLINKTLELKIGYNCELVKMQPDYCGAWDIISYYADLMALASESIAVNLINSKFAYVFAADSKTGAESLKKLYDEIAGGKPAAFADKNLFKEDGSPSWVMFINNLRQNYIGGDLLEDLAKIDSRFNTDIGIPNVNIAKNSGVSDSEVMSNNVDTKSKASLWLETIQDGVNKVNDMFGLDISVSLRFDNLQGGFNDGQTFDNGAL